MKKFKIVEAGVDSHLSRGIDSYCDYEVHIFKSGKDLEMENAKPIRTISLDCLIQYYLINVHEEILASLGEETGFKKMKDGEFYHFMERITDDRPTKPRHHKG